MVCQTPWIVGSPMTWFLVVHILALAPPCGYARVYAHLNSRPPFVFEDLPAVFGNRLPKEGLMGVLIESQPLNACVPVKPPPAPPSPLSVSLTKFIALIREHDCYFDVKVLHAQQAGFSAAVVYSTSYDVLLNMDFSEEGTVRQIEIPSVFIGLTASKKLRKYVIPEKGAYVVLKPHYFIPLLYYLAPFFGAVGFLTLILALTLVTGCVHYRKQLRKNMLSKEQIMKIPLHKFQKGDKYDVCAVCLEEYEDCDKLRVLPCSHAYHCHCVDPWLIHNRKTCPVCKQRVVDPEPTSSPGSARSECGSERGWSGGTELTPLLRPSGPASLAPGSTRAYASTATQNRHFSCCDPVLQHCEDQHHLHKEEEEVSKL